MGVNWFFNPKYVGQLTDEIVKELDERQYVDNLKSVKQHGDHIIRLAYHIEELVHRIDKLEGPDFKPMTKEELIEGMSKVAGKHDVSAGRVSVASSWELPKKEQPRVDITFDDPYYTSLKTDLFDMVARNFPGQYLGDVESGTDEMDRCVKGEAAKFILWGEHSGSNSWINNLRGLVGDRQFWLRRLSWKDLVSPGEGPDRPSFIVLRLLYKE